MKTFRVEYPSGVVDEETVSDCDTVEAYINRKFGSVDPAEYGTKVTEVKETEEEEEEEEEEETDAGKQADKPVKGKAAGTSK